MTRDFNSNMNDEINKEFNMNAITEHNKLVNKDNYNIFWLVDASHMVWYNKHYKKMILVNYVIKILFNNFMIYYLIYNIWIIKKNI